MKFVNSKKLELEALGFSTFVGLSFSILAYVLFMEAFNYRLIFKLGTEDEVPTEEEIDSMKKQLTELCENPEMLMISHRRLKVERLRNPK